MEQLSFEKTKKLLDKNKIPLVKSQLVKDEKALNNAIKEIKFPLTMKVISKNIIHKSDIGGVILNIKNEEQAINSFNKILKKTKKQNPEGILLQKMIQGQEIIVGMKRDPQFGPVLLFGLGGIYVEILKEKSLKITPVDKKSALEMIKEIKLFKILEGARGKEKINIESIAKIIVKLSELSEDKKIVEVDFNPIIATEKTAKVVDARIMIE